MMYYIFSSQYGNVKNNVQRTIVAKSVVKPFCDTVMSRRCVKKDWILVPFSFSLFSSQLLAKKGTTGTSDKQLLQNAFKQNATNRIFNDSKIENISSYI